MDLGNWQYLTFDTTSDDVLHVRLARPPVNAVDQPMYEEIGRCFSRPDAVLAGVRAIVLSGEGPHFCAGNDLDEFASMTPVNGSERMRRVREAFFAIQDCPVPVIAAVHGAALGTGLAIAASCDIILCSPDARFGLPELTVGVMGGARHLARLGAQPLVRRMFFTGEPLTGNDLAAAGGAVLVCAEGELLTKAFAYASRIASFSPSAVRLGKQILNQIETMDLKPGYAFEQSHTVALSGHPDSKEALSAYRDKRVPKYLKADGGAPRQ